MAETRQRQAIFPEAEPQPEALDKASAALFATGRVLALCTRHTRPLTVLYMDLDNFKQVNDSRGHQAGDRLIQLVGRGLLRAVRASDLAARLGGDEFGLLLPETGFAEAEVFIDRLRQSLDDEVDRAYWSVGYSVGVVTFPTPPADLEAATALADQLMYEKKTAGRVAGCTARRTGAAPRHHRRRIDPRREGQRTGPRASAARQSPLCRYDVPDIGCSLKHLE